jgi:hypothetical protein
VAIAYLWVAPISAFIEDIFVFSIPNYARRRGLPFPGLGDVLASIDKLGIYAPLLIGLAVALSFLLARPRIRVTETDAGSGRRDWLIITLGAIVAVMYLKGLVRVSTAHLMAAIIPSVVLLAVVAPRAWRQGRGAQALVVIAAAASIMAPIHAALTEAGERIDERVSVLAKVIAVAAEPPGNPAGACPTPPELGNIHCLLLDPDREQAARIVAANTRPGERIFVGLARHDKIFMNDMAMYFAADRMPATRWYHFDSGLQTRADIQEKIIEELRSQAVGYAVLESTWDWIGEPNESAKSSGVHLLDDYLRKNFHPVATFGEIVLLHRNGSAP